MQPFQVAFRPSRLQRVLQLAAWAWLAVIWLVYFSGWLCLLGLALTTFAAWYALRRPLPIGSLTVGSQAESIADSHSIRAGALQCKVFIQTTLAGAEALVEGVKSLDHCEVYALQGLHEGMGENITG